MMISHYESSLHYDWDVYLPYVCAAYNSQIHTRSHLNPYEIVHGKKMSTPYKHPTVPSTFGNSHSVKQCNHAAFLQQYNNKAVDRKYKVGDFVYMNNQVWKKNQVKKFQQAWKGPYPFIEVCLQSPLCFSCHSIVIIHVNRVQLHYLHPRKLHPSSPPVKKKLGSPATPPPEPASAGISGKGSKVSSPNSPSAPVRPTIPFNLRRRHQ
ncbi:hypothetical protein PR048_013838 [Dryococelus australis]|uniref:Uncharacterized protein n=1 Tax=Dryococelus australis TaxID=614101 RepID=A0ABQ9HTE8_9NEOP|nr:hypothetical protein PR048_013838 [Dryococelus australis]